MATIRKHPRANSWQVMYRDPSGKQRSKNFEQKTPAKRFAAAVETDKRRGAYIDPQIARTTFGEYAEVWRAGRRGLALSTQDRNILEECMAISAQRKFEVQDNVPNDTNRAAGEVFDKLKKCAERMRDDIHASSARPEVEN